MSEKYFFLFFLTIFLSEYSNAASCTDFSGTWSLTCIKSSTLTETDVNGETKGSSAEDKHVEYTTIEQNECQEMTLKSHKGTTSEIEKSALLEFGKKHELDHAFYGYSIFDWKNQDQSAIVGETVDEDFMANISFISGNSSKSKYEISLNDDGKLLWEVRTDYSSFFYLNSSEERSESKSQTILLCEGTLIP